MARAAALIVSLLLALTACGGAKVADPPVASSTPAPPSTSAGPSAPVMPALAKEHTAAGAKAFALYYWDVVNYAQETLDTTPLGALADANCQGCARGVSGIEDIKNAGGSISGGTYTASVTSSGLGKRARAVLTLDVTSEDETVTESSSTSPYPGGVDKMLMILVPQATGWSIDQLEVQ